MLVARFVYWGVQALVAFYMVWLQAVRPFDSGNGRLSWSTDSKEHLLHLT